MADFTVWGITVLYGLGGFLPILGIWLAVARIWRPVRAYAARQRHVARLRSIYQQREQSINSEDERDELEVWREEEFSKTDKFGVAYNHSDAVLFGYSPIAQQASRFNDLLRDAIFIGLGVVCATAASIWSIWAGMAPN